jgi:ribosome biogenesis GTPase
MQGLIVENISNIYRVKVGNEIYETIARGKFRKDEIIPVVGDRVKIRITDESGKKAVIEEIIDRQVYVKRPKLANITQIVLVISSKDPKPDLLMLDKQLAFSEFLGINAIIVLNKIDLDKKEEFKEIKDVYSKIGYSVFETDAKIGKGIEELKIKLYGNVNAFSGNSGVGKSTLLNKLLKKEVTQEGIISARNKRGKNTTTFTRLYEIDENTYIADTPGFSTFSIEEIKSKDLEEYFREFKTEKQNCEFVGCTHIKEENCGVKKAINEHKIDKAIYERFCKIYNDLKQREERR